MRSIAVEKTDDSEMVYVESRYTFSISIDKFIKVRMKSSNIQCKQMNGVNPT